MRILIISGAFPPMSAGEADHVFHLCHHLAARGAEVHLLTSISPAVDEELPFTVHRQLHDWSWRSLPRLLRKVTGIAPEGVLLFYTAWIYKRHPMITFVPLLSKLLQPGRPFVTQLETEEEAFNLSLPTRVLMKILRLSFGSRLTADLHIRIMLYGSDHVITLSERHENRLLERFRRIEGRTLAIPPPPIMHMRDPGDTDRSRVREKYGIASDDFLLVNFGYIHPAKGVDILFEALALLKRRGRRVKLLIVGGGVDLARPSADVLSLTELAGRLGIEDRVAWTGEYRSDSSDASGCFRAADACVLPFTGGVTLNRSSVAAASAHGLPIISTRGATLEAAFVDRANVYLCPTGDAQSLCLAIEELMDSPSLRERLGAGALRLADDYFSWEGAVDRTLDALCGGESEVGRRFTLSNADRSE